MMPVSSAEEIMNDFTLDLRLTESAGVAWGAQLAYGPL